MPIKLTSTIESEVKCSRLPHCTTPGENMGAVVYMNGSPWSSVVKSIQLYIVALRVC